MPEPRSEGDSTNVVLADGGKSKLPSRSTEIGCFAVGYAVAVLVLACVA